VGISLQRQITGVEPVTLDEMKTHLRVDFNNDDDLITSLLVAARERVETVTGRCLVASTFTYWLDSFPWNWQTDSAPARSTVNRFVEWWANAQVIRIPQPPLKAITTVEYLPSGDASAYVTLDPNVYVVDTNASPAVIYPKTNYYFPYTYAVHNAVKITFTAGYDEVPETLKVAIRLIAANWYENREDSADIPKAAEYILASYRSQPCGYVR
jgi:uncharacterized phiE125 gp8 family phage protein